MRNIPQPIDITNPKHDWRKNFGRLRLGWMSRTAWWLYGYRKRNWFFVCRNNIKYDWRNGKETTRFIQFTICGFQVAYLYKGQIPKTA